MTDKIDGSSSGMISALAPAKREREGKKKDCARSNIILNSVVVRQETYNKILA